MKRLITVICFAIGIASTLVAEQPTSPLPGHGLLLDLDADHGLTLEEEDRVSRWTNQVAGAKAKDFVKRDEGRQEKGSGRPTLRKKVEELNGHNALVFRQGELVNGEEDVFDGITTGKGFTWFCILAVHEQRLGLKDVNSFLGNLRNGGNYEGLWCNLRDDNTLWMGGRNGISFGRFDRNNPQVLGPKLEKNRFYLVAGRMDAGTGEQNIEIFVNEKIAVATGVFPVNKKANPSRLAIGQERDATEHPGRESFDGELARILIYERPLDDQEITDALKHLRMKYGIRQ